MGRENEFRADPARDADEDRRKFLAVCGRFAVVTPPAVTVLLSTSLTSQAVAQSGGRGGPPRGGPGLRGGDRDRDDEGD